MTSSTDRDLIARAEAVFNSLTRALVEAAAPPFVAEFGLSFEEIDGLALTSAPGIPHNYLNSILGLGVHEPATREQVDNLLARHPGKRIKLAPHARPAELPDWLTEHGYVDAARVTFYVYEDQPLEMPETSLRVERLTADTGIDFAAVCGAVGRLSDFVKAAGVPPERLHPWFAALAAQPDCFLYAAYDGDTPVASAMLHILNDIGWLAFASTLPSHRGLGAQSALIVRRMQDALDMGCSELYVGTSMRTADALSNVYHTSRSNLFRFGFRELVTMPSFVPPSRAQV